MPYQSNINLPTSLPQPQPLTLDSWRKGVITLLDKSRIPRDACTEMKNLFLAENGTPTPRWGVNWYGTSPANKTIWGVGTYTKADGTVHLLVSSNTKIYRSTDNAQTWTECTGATVTASTRTNFEQNGGFTYITTGTDDIIRYDGTTTLVTYTSLSTPAKPSKTESGSTVMGGTGYKHYYKVSAINNIGSSIASPASDVVEASIDRLQWNPTTDFVDITWATIANAERYDLFVSKDNIKFYYISSTIGNGSTTYRDNGSAPENILYEAPIQNSTKGPKVEELATIGERLWGFRDTQNPNRIWWTGSGPQAGNFAPAYNGGYIDLMPGTQYKVSTVKDYRDGKNEPNATVWMGSSDSIGGIWQIRLETITVEGYQLTMPVSVRLPGSRGTNAPGSVVSVLNDYHFFNSQAFYNLGSRAQFLNLLSSDEISSNIRPSVKTINQAGVKNIATTYIDAKVFYSVPVGASTSNNQTIVYDTERRAWVPEAFDIGFTDFLPYTEVNGDVQNRLLLAYKQGDTKLSYIDSTLQGDYGQPFTTVLTTGLYPVTKDRFEFIQVDDAEVEFSQPKGEIFVELIGIERSGGYQSLKSQTIEDTNLNVGWSTFAWSTTKWSDTSEAPEVYSESSIKRYFRVLRELNAYQWRITTNSLKSDYFLRTLQIKGTPTQAGLPRKWRIN